MKNINQELNGLMDGISLIEKDRKESANLEAAIVEDIIYTQQDHSDSFEDPYTEKEFTISHYNQDSFYVGINLLSVGDVEINEDWSNDAIF